MGTSPSPAPQKKNQAIAEEIASKNGRSWIAKFGVEDGEWLIAAKDQFRYLMRPGNGHTVKTRTLAALILHSMGYKDQQAWRQIRTSAGIKTVPYTSRHIVADLNEATELYFKECGVELTDKARSTGYVTRQNVRRAIAGLEKGGAVERRLKDGKLIRELTPEQSKAIGGHSDILIYVFCRPKPGSREQAEYLLKLWEDVVTKTPKVTTCACLESIPYAVPILKKLGFDYIIAKFAARPEVVNMDYIEREVKPLIESFKVDMEDYKKAGLVVQEDYRKRLEVVLVSPHIERKEEKGNIERKGEAPPPVPFPSPDPKAGRQASSTTDEKTAYLPAEVAAAIPTALLEKLHDAPELPLLERLGKKVWPAPLADFTERIFQKLKTIKSFGLLEPIADDVRRAYEQTAPNRKAKAASAEHYSRAASAQATESRKADIEWAHGVIENPDKATKKDLEVAKVLLASG